MNVYFCQLLKYSQMKKSFFLLVFVVISSSAFTQNVIDSKISSVFANFNQLGVSKEIFIKEFGNPIAKDMSYDKDKNKNEVLYYIEKFKKEDFLIITKFTFINNELVEQKSIIKYVEIEELIKKISDDLTYIRRWN